MKKLVSLIIVLFTFLISINQTVVYAARGVGHSDPREGKFATYELYYHYKDEEDAYKGQHRLTLSIYNTNQFVIKSSSSNLLHDDAYRLFPEFKKYVSEIDYQIDCHIFGEIVGETQKEWDIEIQRKIPAIMYPIEVSTKCNEAYWVDNTLIFDKRVKFNNQVVVANKWIYYDPKSGSDREWYYVNENYVGVVGWKK